MPATTADLSGLVKAYDVRGVVPDDWGPATAEALGAAFAEVVVRPGSPDGPLSARPSVVLGRDMRDSGPGLVDAFAAGLTARGVDVVRIGLCSTDGLYHASGVLDVPGAMFTASHNPAALQRHQDVPGGSPPGRRGDRVSRRSASSPRRT